MMAVVTSQLISKLFKLQKEIFERGLTVTLTQDTCTSGERDLFLKVIILAENQEQKTRRRRKKSANQKRKEKAGFFAWMKRNRVEKKYSTVTSTPLTNPQAANKSINAKKRKVSSAKLSPPSWQGIPQYEGGETALSIQL